MNKYTWYVFQYKDKYGKMLASYMRIRNNYNLVPYMGQAVFVGDHKAEIYSMNACDTKKEAVSLAEAWNQSFKDQGRYFLDYK